MYFAERYRGVCEPRRLLVGEAVEKQGQISQEVKYGVCRR